MQMSCFSDFCPLILVSICGSRLWQLFLCFPDDDFIFPSFLPHFCFLCVFLLTFSNIINLFIIISLQQYLLSTYSTQAPDGNKQNRQKSLPPDNERKDNKHVRKSYGILGGNKCYGKKYSRVSVLGSQYTTILKH